MSNVNSLNKADLKAWGMNILKYEAPAILTVLVTLSGLYIQSHRFPNLSELLFVAGVGYAAVLASLIDLLNKFRNGE